ncbi:MAG: rhodanese-like domain-containing protein [Bacteroidaceae bacterium]|nr:rhodanese-like domain-containing protein [Bacteroidaceae bacterium]
MRQFFNKILLGAMGLLCFTGCGSAGKSGGAGDILAPAEYMKMLQSDEKAYLLDVRRADEYAAGHLPGAVLLDVTDSVAFARSVELLDKEKNIYIYCRSGRRSRKAADILTAKGFKVTDMQGGYNAWKETFNK